jgi:hypothetical protein
MSVDGVREKFSEAIFEIVEQKGNGRISKLHNEQINTR